MQAESQELGTGRCLKVRKGQTMVRTGHVLFLCGQHSYGMSPTDSVRSHVGLQRKNLIFVQEHLRDTNKIFLQSHNSYPRNLVGF